MGVPPSDGASRRKVRLNPPSRLTVFIATFNNLPLLVENNEIIAE